MILLAVISGTRNIVTHQGDKAETKPWTVRFCMFGIMTKERRTNKREEENPVDVEVKIMEL